MLTIRPKQNLLQTRKGIEYIKLTALFYKTEFSPTRNALLDITNIVVYHTSFHQLCSRYFFAIIGVCYNAVRTYVVKGNEINNSATLIGETPSCIVKGLISREGTDHLPLKAKGSFLFFPGPRKIPTCR